MLCKKEKPGFTLIELLVVIAIISMLVGIIYPSFARARQLAKLASCSATLTGIGRAVQMYLNEHNVMPKACQMPSVEIPNFDVSMTTFPEDIPEVPIWKALEQYTSKANFLCVADEGPIEDDGYRDEHPGMRYWDVEGSSYEYFLLAGDPEIFKKILEFAKGDSKVVIMAGYDHFHGDKGKLHNRNYLFVDGHVGDIVEGDVKTEEDK